MRSSRAFRRRCWSETDRSRCDYRPILAVEESRPSRRSLCSVRQRDGSPALTVAGLWDEWRDKANGETLKSCTMIIT
jgi:putative SOS response-associated peptidase YedK